MIDPEGEGGERVGFELAGPFELGSDGDGSRFQLDYTQIRGDEEATVAVISTGDRAYVTIGDETYELPPDRAAELTGAGAVLGGEGLGELDVGAWLQDPALSDGDDIGGDETDRIEATLDVAAAARDLIDLARRAGAVSAPALTAEDAQRLAEAADTASVELLTGRDDRLLRRLDAHVEIGLEVPEELESVLGRVVGTNIDFELGIARPNQEITVEAPADARPPSDYPG